MRTGSSGLNYSIECRLVLLEHLGMLDVSTNAGEK